MNTKLVSKSLLTLGALAILAGPAFAQGLGGPGGPPSGGPQGQGPGQGAQFPSGSTGAGPQMGQGSGRGPQDLDGDGQISKEEFLAPAEARFKSHDTDGDGAITLEEVVAHASERFQQADANNDGYLSPEEMPKPPGANGGGQGQRPPEE
ncbi:MAG: EF-hand domain-containing protein [bacterium]